MSWLQDFRRETAPVISEPFLLCLAEALASVESANGRRAIRNVTGFNEIGYKAIPGKPSMLVDTHEALIAGSETAHPAPASFVPTLVPRRVAFRLFRDRREQAESLLWLMRGSPFYESARLLFVLAFYMCYAPGRIDGAAQLLRIFNRLAGVGVHARVRPFALIAPADVPPDVSRHNHAAARHAVRLFAELTNALGAGVNPNDHRRDPLKM